MRKLKVQKKIELGKVDIKDFLIELLKAHHLKGVHIEGHNIVSECPFHTTDSANYRTFSVCHELKRNKRTGEENYYYNCFSCGERGDVLRLVASLQNCSLEKAYKSFSKKVLQAGITIRGLTDAYERHRASIKHIRRLPLVGMPKALHSLEPALEYFKKRKRLSHGTLNVPFIFAKYKPYYCAVGRYAGRIIMPLKDLEGRVVEFNDRAVFKTKKKSLHRRGSPVGQLIYGLYEAAEKSIGVVSEGAFDMYQVESVISRHKELREYGAVSLMGTVLTQERIELLTTTFDELVLLLDSEPKAISESKVMKDRLEVDIPVRDLTGCYTLGKDPGLMDDEEILEVLAHDGGEKRMIDILLEGAGMV